MGILGIGELSLSFGGNKSFASFCNNFDSGILGGCFFFFWSFACSCACSCSGGFLSESDASAVFAGSFSLLSNGSVSVLAVCCCGSSSFFWLSGAFWSESLDFSLSAFSSGFGLSSSNLANVELILLNNFEISSCNGLVLSLVACACSC